MVEEDIKQLSEDQLKRESVLENQLDGSKVLERVTKKYKDTRRRRKQLQAEVCNH